MTEATDLSGGTRAARGLRKPDKRNRRGRRNDVRVMRRTRLPRILDRQTGPGAIEVTRYMEGLVERFRLSRVLPLWAEPTVIDAAKAHLVLQGLHRDLLAQEKLPEPSRAECRRLRSEIRRTTSQRRVAENILGKLCEEQRKVTGPTSLRALARG